jgi:hypothetical protein
MLLTNSRNLLTIVYENRKSSVIQNEELRGKN